LNIVGKRRAEYSACVRELKHGGRMSDGIPGRRELVEGLGGRREENIEMDR
jgi:hypothetical protein